MRDTPEWRNWQTRLTQNQVLRSVGSSPTSGTNAKAAGKIQAFPAVRVTTGRRFYIPSVQAEDYPQLHIEKDW